MQNSFQIRYWYFGPLKSKWAYIRSTLTQWPSVISGKISYIPATEENTKLTKIVIKQPVPEVRRSWWNILYLFYKPRPQHSQGKRGFFVQGNIHCDLERKYFKNSEYEYKVRLCLNSKCSRINFNWVTGFELQRFMRKLRLRMARMRKPSQRMSHLWNSLSLPPLLKGSRRYVITDTCSYDSHMMKKYM